jgi:hypothetical protein
VGESAVLQRIVRPVSTGFFVSVTRRAVPAGFVVAAAFADASGSPLVAFYAFLALVPVAAVIALNSYGELVETPPAPEEDETHRRLQVLLWAVLLVLAVLGAASRAPVLGEGAVPRLGGTAVIACLLVLSVEGIVELVAQTRRKPPRRARVTASEG